MIGNSLAHSILKKKCFGATVLPGSVKGKKNRSRQKAVVNGKLSFGLFRAHNHTEFKNSVFRTDGHGTLMLLCKMLNGTQPETMA